MYEQRLAKKIEDQAKIFKSRAIKGRGDDKRHDVIKRDEQKWMRTAYNKLGWSYEKIGLVFNRDPRTVEKEVQEGSKVKEPSPEANPTKDKDETPKPKSAEFAGETETETWQKQKEPERHTENINTQHCQIWEHYKKLQELILSLEYANDNNRSKILANIERERTEIGDNGLNEILTPFLDQIDWDIEFNAEHEQPTIRHVIETTRHYMIKKYKR